MTVKVNAVVYFRVVGRRKRSSRCSTTSGATSQIAQTTLRSVLGQSSLDELLADREKINERLQKIIDEQTEPWGVKVTTVEVKDVELPQSMQRAMARSGGGGARAAREDHQRRGRVPGGRAAGAGRREHRRQQPATLQLRYLQTLAEIATEKNSTIVFPVPIDIIRAFIEKGGAAVMPSPGGDDGDDEGVAGTAAGGDQPPAEAGAAAVVTGSGRGRGSRRRRRRTAMLPSARRSSRFAVGVDVLGDSFLHVIRRLGAHLSGRASPAALARPHRRRR